MNASVLEFFQTYLPQIEATGLDLFRPIDAMVWPPAEEPEEPTPMSLHVDTPPPEPIMFEDLVEDPSPAATTEEEEEDEEEEESTVSEASAPDPTPEPERLPEAVMAYRNRARLRYMDKRKRRVWGRHVRFEVRSRQAQMRPRVAGKFVPSANGPYEVRRREAMQLARELKAQRSWSW